MELQQAIPDNLPEAIATIIITVLSWWLGRKTKKTKRY